MTWQVHNILAEMVMGGMVLETNMNEIITQVDAQNKMEKSEVSKECPCRATVMYSLTPLPLKGTVYAGMSRMLHPACYSPVPLWMLPTYSWLFVALSLALRLATALLSQHRTRLSRTLSYTYQWEYHVGINSSSPRWLNISPVIQCISGIWISPITVLYLIPCPFHLKIPVWLTVELLVLGMVSCVKVIF